MCRIGQGGHSRVVASAQSALTLISGSGQPQAPCGEHHSLSRVRRGAGPGVTQRITSCAVLDLINLASREALIQNRPCIVWARIGPARASNERNQRPYDERPEGDHAEAHHSPSPLVPSISVHHIIGATDLSALRGYDLQCPRISHGTHQGRIRSRVRPATERCARRRSCRTSGSPLFFEQSTLDRVADHLGTGGRPELGHDVGTVALDRPDADVELLGDLLVGMTKGEQTQHLTLAR